MRDYSNKQKNKKTGAALLMFLVIFLGFLMVGGYFIWENNISPVNHDDTTKREFMVERGTSVRAIANSLKTQGYIREPLAFIVLVRATGLADNLQAGTFQLSPSMNATQIAQALTHGTNDISVTIPEGKRAAEIAEILEKDMPNYDFTWKRKLEDNEGYLFPETYFFPKESTIEEIISIMRQHFDENYSSITTSNTNRSKEEIVTIASMIEREARKAEDRSLVSSVMHNRLDINMALQIDATVQYALGYNLIERTWWKRNLTLDDLSIDSLYNTYQNPGLPPSPISNPGLASLTAAANPANTDYLYYITDKTGVNRYAKNLNEHNTNISRYGL